MLKQTPSGLPDGNARPLEDEAPALGEPVIAEPPPRDEGPADLPENSAKARAPEGPAGVRRAVVPRELVEDFVGHMRDQFAIVPLIGPGPSAIPTDCSMRTRRASSRLVGHEASGSINRRKNRSELIYRCLNAAS